MIRAARSYGLWPGLLPSASPQTLRPGPLSGLRLDGLPRALQESHVCSKGDSGFVPRFDAFFSTPSLPPRGWPGMGRSDAVRSWRRGLLDKYPHSELRHLHRGRYRTTRESVL
jgi:hypothetical protein